MSIATVVPVLGRPHRIKPLGENWAQTAQQPGRLIFVASPEDEETLSVLRDLEPEHIVTNFEAGPGDFARKVNLVYELTDDDWIFAAGDDVTFMAGWDTCLLLTATIDHALVVGSNDCRNPTVKRGAHATHILFARSYCDDPGASADGPRTVFSTAYGHQYCDTEAVELARRRGVWAFAEAAHVVHEHPFWVPHGRRDLWDATYEKGMASARQDAVTWRQRRRSYMRGV